MTTRFASGIHFHKERVDLLLWVEKVALPDKLIASSGLEESWYSLLRSNEILVSDKELIANGLLKANNVFEGKTDNRQIHFGGSTTFDLKSKKLTSWSPKDFHYYLQNGGLNAPSIYDHEASFAKDFPSGNEPSLSILINAPKIDFDHMDFKQFINFITSDETQKLRRRLFNWQNEISKKNLKPNEIQELIATRLDDYKTWIDTTKMKYEVNRFELVLTIGAEVLENLLQLKPSKAIKALFDFSKRELDLTLNELQAPGRELAYIYHIQDRFGQQTK